MSTVAQHVLQTWAKSRDTQPPTIVTHPSQQAVADILEPLTQAMFGQPSTQSHPDLHLFQSEKATITIKEIRALLDQLLRTPFADQRLVVIANAEKLSQPAANALLKSLEEPSLTTKWLLLTAYPRQLLPTIRSRSQIVRLPHQASTSKPDELEQIFNELHKRLQQQGPTPDIRRGYLRLRDYYMIRSRRGNTKLAREILELSVPFTIYP